jgi:cell division protein FtsI/penicillin-binding protein 2
MNFRLRVIIVGILLLQVLVAGRLFYWQILQRETLSEQAQAQYSRTQLTSPTRGSIYTSDGYLLAGTLDRFRLYLVKEKQETAPAVLSAALSPLLITVDPAYQLATSSAEKSALLETMSLKIEQTATAPTDKKWLALANNINQETKTAIEQLNLPDLSFEAYPARDYPEASMAAHVLGFVAKDSNGNDTGYFGVEGKVDQELHGSTSLRTFQTDALGQQLLNSDASSNVTTNGRDVYLSIRRDVQHIIETELATSIERYGARAGEIIVMDPHTGKILGMAALPSYQPEFFFAFPQNVYKNPSLADSYEPGSTFKVLTVAAGIDAGVITPETECPSCSNSRIIDGYTIKTWNNEYHPNISMSDALAKSDNTAMIYIAEKLGAEQFMTYLKKFKIGLPTQVELQEDTSSAWPEKWDHIELATRSFGQGIQVNSLQLLRAVASIANNGQMMKPSIIDKVVDPVSRQEIPVPPQPEGQVVTPQTAKIVSQMMEYAAKKGEAQWISSTKYSVAAKTGTSQIPEKGGYSADKTIASFIGFSPVEQPKFIMLVKLIEPQSSIWAAETAAPLWYRVADKLQLLL